MRYHSVENGYRTPCFHFEFQISNLFEVFLAVILDDIVHILITSAGEADEHRAVRHLLGEADTVGYRVRALDSGDNALKARKTEECVDCLVVTDGVVLNSAEVAQECVLGA